MDSRHKRVVSNSGVVPNHEQGQENPLDNAEQNNLVNFKGIYYGDTNEKFHDEKTGAHFRYKDMY